MSEVPLCNYDRLLEALRTTEKLLETLLQKFGSLEALRKNLGFLLEVLAGI